MIMQLPIASTFTQEEIIIGSKSEEDYAIYFIIEEYAVNSFSLTFRAESDVLVVARRVTDINYINCIKIIAPTT